VAAIVDSEAAAVALGTALNRLHHLVPHLSAAIDPAGLEHSADQDDAAPDGVSPAAMAERPLPADRAWVPAADLIADPAWLGRIIMAAGRAVGTEDPAVASSFFIQGYSYRLLGLTIGTLLAAGVAPDASAPHLAVAWNGPWPSLVAFLRPVVLVSDQSDDLPMGHADDATLTDGLRFVVHTTIDRHLKPLVAAVRAGIGHGVGERLLWGDVAASAATALRTMQGCLGPSVESFGPRFFALAPASLQGLGSFVVIEEAGGRGWFWERTACCLFDRLPEGIRCADCSLTPPEERRAAYRRSLQGA
jgi:hypothetical protein